MEYVFDAGTYVVRLEKGEEILASIKSLCEKEGIRAGTIQGLGAVNEAKVGLLLTAEKRYASTVLSGDMEIVSLVGNISEKDGECYLHVHASFADKDYIVKGGHLNYAKISATAEIYITQITRKIGRLYDESVGLNLLVL